MNAHAFAQAHNYPAFHLLWADLYIFGELSSLNFELSSTCERCHYSPFPFFVTCRWSHGWGSRDDGNEERLVQHSIHECTD